MISPPQTWPIFMGSLWKFQDKDCHDAVTPGAWTPGAAAVRCPMCCEAHAGSGWGCKEQELVCCGTYWVVAAPLARSCWNVWWLRFWSRELVLGLRDCGYSFSSFCIFTNVFLYLFVSFFVIYFFLVVAPTVDSFSMFFHVFHAIAEKQWMIILVPKSVPDLRRSWGLWLIGTLCAMCVILGKAVEGTEWSWSLLFMSHGTSWYW